MSETNYSTGGPSETSPPERRRDWGAISAAVIAVLALLAVGWLEKLAWDRLKLAEREVEISQVSQLYSGMALREPLTNLKLAALLSQISGEEKERLSFQAEARRLATLIADCRTTARTDEERKLANQIETAAQEFVTATENLAPLKGIRRGAVEALSAELDRMMAPVNGAVTVFSKAQDKARRSMVASSLQTFQSSRRALQYSLVGLVVLLGSLALLTHRTFFVPLKSQLDATAAASVRHEKLASMAVLATGVAHEIRNPLTAIKFRLFSLKKALGPGLSENEDFQTIRNEIDRLERLVKSFLEFARPAEPNFANIDAADLLEEVQNLLSPEMSKQKVAIHLDAGEGLSFLGDKQQLQQVLINLAQNAGDSMPDGGTITLRARNGAAVLSKRTEPVVLLEVIDTGMGIPAEVQKRLFDPFFSTKEGGTGLGLAIAGRIVEQHDGLMQFSTRKDQGTTFTIILPNQGKHA